MLVYACSAPAVALMVGVIKQRAARIAADAARRERDSSDAVYASLTWSREAEKTGREAERRYRAFFDANGTQTAVFPFPNKVPNDSLPEGNSALIATQAFAALPGAPRPDFIIPPFVAAPGGKVCFRGSRCFLINICLSYGPFRGDAEGAGGPAPALPILGATSVQRFQRFEDPGLGTGSQFNSDFRLGAPAPRNDEGTAGIVVESGGTCHVAPPPPPCSVTDIGSATVVSLNGTTQGASNVLGGSCGGADAPEQVFLYTAPRSGSYAIDTRGSTLDTVLYVLDGSVGPSSLATTDQSTANQEWS